MRVFVWIVLIANVISAGDQAVIAVDASVPPFLPLLWVAIHLILALMMRDILVSRRIC